MWRCARVVRGSGGGARGRVKAGVENRRRGEREQEQGTVAGAGHSWGERGEPQTARDVM